MASSPVEVEELASSPAESGTREGDYDFARWFKVAWSDRIDFVNHMFNDGPFGLPVQHPDADFLFVYDFTIEPLIPDPRDRVPTIADTYLHYIQHTLAVVKIGYKPLTEEGEAPAGDPDLPTGTWATYTARDSGEFITIPSRTMKWESDFGPDSPPVSPDAHPTIAIPLTDHVVTWFRVPNPPFSTIEDRRGEVNDEPFRFPTTGIEMPKETLLFMGSSKERHFTLKPNGVPTWRLEFVFSERNIKNFGSEGTDYGWNHAWRDHPAKWDKPKDYVSGELMYQLGDFKGLFA